MPIVDGETAALVVAARRDREDLVQQPPHGQDPSHHYQHRHPQGD